MTTKRTGWSEERRKKQSELMHRLKPWKNSTGPRTEEGKDAAKYNAFKNGQYDETNIALRKALFRQRMFVNTVRAAIASERE